MQGGEPHHKHDRRQGCGDPSGPEPRRSPRHSLFTGADGWLVLYLIQLVDFMLLQREPNKTVHVSAWKPKAGHKEDFWKGSSSCFFWESNCIPDHYPAELSSNRQQENTPKPNNSKPSRTTAPIPLCPPSSATAFSLKGQPFTNNVHCSLREKLLHEKRGARVHWEKGWYLQDRDVGDPIQGAHEIGLNEQVLFPWKLKNAVP